MIVTVTLNPAIDEEYMVPEFVPGGWFRASTVDRSPGGKGINVSMTLKQLGYDSAAMGFLAGFNGEYIRDSMRRIGLTTNFVHVHGETRTNVYVVDEVGHVETGIAELGPYISEDAIGRFLANYQRMLRRASLVMLGGSLPPGTPQDFYRDLVRMTREAGIPTVIDAAGAPLMAALEAGPTVARVDHRFVSRLSGVSLNSLDNLIETVTRIHDQGVEWAVTSYRTYSHVFSTPGGVYLAEFERKGLASLFGAEDALIAGILVARKEQMDVEQSIRFGLACAWEDALHLEKGVRGRESVESLVSRVRLEKLS